MYSPLLLPDLRMMLQENDAVGLREFCDALHPAVAAEVLEGLESESVWKVLSHSSLSRQVEIFEFLSLAKQIELVAAVDRKRLSKLLEEMAPDDRVDLLSRMDPDRVESLLPLIAQAERNDIRKLLSFPEDSAGAIMTTEYASLPEEITVAEALQRLRQQAPDSETIYYVYIVDQDRRLDGLITLRELILAKPNAKLADIMRRDVISVRAEDDKELVAQEIGKYDLIAIPVVDKTNQLVGIITHDDILDVVQEEATEDAYKQGAVGPLEDSYLDTPLKTIIQKRAVWLTLLSLVSLTTAQVIFHYKHVSEAYVWMAMFLPLVLATGGNAGSQSATLVIRTLALGDLAREQHLRLSRRELLIALALGLWLASIVFGVTLTWFDRQPRESLVVAMTVLLVVLMAAVTGALLPLVFKRLGMDPALMSNPLIAALVDVFGSVIYYTVAILLLKAAGS